ncbi:hypothetical protein BASA60_008390 [Batrachochytrium salamandrivorans]|nr:hypothetical protein BASA60_008390 [Batrachochytrium salamandrivorans]
MLMVSKKIQDAIDLFSSAWSLSPAFVLPAMSIFKPFLDPNSTSASSTTSISISSKSTHTVPQSHRQHLFLTGAGVCPSSNGSETETSNPADVESSVTFDFGWPQEELLLY